MSVKDDIKEYLVTEILVYYDKKSVEPDEDLLKQGVIDSMGVLEIVRYLDKKFGVEVADEEIVPENFRSLNCLTEFVNRKTQGQVA